MAFFRNNQDLPSKRAPKTYVSPQKSNCRDQSQSLVRPYSSRRTSSLYDKYDRQNTNRRSYNTTRSPSPNRYYNENYSRILRISSKSVTPHRVTSHSHFHPIKQNNQSPAFVKIQTTSKMFFKLFVITDFFLMWEYQKEKNILDGTTGTGSSWFKPLKVSVKKPTQKSEPNFPGTEILVGTVATISILNSPTWNKINIPLQQFKYDYEIY